MTLLKGGVLRPPRARALVRSSSNAAACLRPRSLPSAGDVAHVALIGALHVPRFPSAFQSQSSGANRPHAQRGRRLVPQTIARSPPGKVTVLQAIRRSARWVHLVATKRLLVAPD